MPKESASSRVPFDTATHTFDIYTNITVRIKKEPKEKRSDLIGFVTGHCPLRCQYKKTGHEENYVRITKGDVKIGESQQKAAILHKC